MGRWLTNSMFVCLLLTVSGACSSAAPPENTPIDLGSSDVQVTVVDEGATAPELPATVPDTSVVAPEDSPVVQEIVEAPDEASTPEPDLGSPPVPDFGSTPTPDLGGPGDDSAGSAEIPPVITLLPGLHGDPAPNNDFITEDLLAAVVDETNASVSIDQVLGHWTVLWFYPKANTSG